MVVILFARLKVVCDRSGNQAHQARTETVADRTLQPKRIGLIDFSRRVSTPVGNHLSQAADLLVAQFLGEWRVLAVGQ
jgi:hypothetical protein